MIVHLIIFLYFLKIAKNLNINFNLRVRLPSHSKPSHFLPFLSQWKTRGRSKIKRSEINRIKANLFLSHPHLRRNGKPSPNWCCRRQNCNHHLPASAIFSNTVGQHLHLGFFFILLLEKEPILFSPSFFFFSLHVLTDPDLKSSKCLRFFNLNLQNQSLMSFKPDLQAHLTLICMLLRKRRFSYVKKTIKFVLVGENFRCPFFVIAPTVENWCNDPNVIANLFNSMLDF